MIIKQRTMQSEPGQPLLLPAHPATHVANLSDFLDVTGLSPEQVHADPLAIFPMPVYRDGSGPRQFAGLRPEAAWHPLFWLPRSVAGVLCLTRNADGSPAVQEDAGHHMIRVAIELGLSGLYDEADGTWVDVLALHDLDIDDPAVLERARRWLAGEPDSTFDQITLDDYLGSEQTAAAYALADEMRDSLVVCAAALHSDALAGDLAAATLEDQPDRASVVAIAGLASSFLPVEPPPNAEQSAWTPFADLAAAASGVDPGAVIGQLSSQLLRVREHCWPIMAQRIEAMSSTLTEIGATETKEPEVLTW